MDVPKIYQHYPDVPLSDLSDLYSVGENALGTQRACIVSYLPKILRVGSEPEQTLKNKYVLFLEDTTTVDSILWNVIAYQKGAPAENIDLYTYIYPDNATSNEFIVYLDFNLFGTGEALAYDKLVVTCTIVKGSNNLELSIEHSLVKMFDFDEITENNDIKPGLYDWWFVSNKPTTNYLLNAINDYLTDPELKWYCTSVLTDVTEKENLIKTVTGILYFFVLHNSEGENYNIIDLPDFENLNISTYINTTDSTIDYDGGYRNGFTQIPLYLLNDIFTDITQIPDFSNISETDDKLYAILKDASLENPSTKPDNDDNISDLMNSKIKESKKRLHDDKTKLTQWYILTLFPKSCIKLTAILIKYIFECSKKNACNECYKKEDAWTSINFSQIDEYENFLKNILTHYYVGPSGKIKSIPKPATKTYRYIWSIYIDFIVNNRPRIVTAYFAKKVVTEIGATQICNFQRLDSTQTRIMDDGTSGIPEYDSILGRQIYLIVETVNCRGKQLFCNVQSAPDSTLGSLTITSLTGNTDNLELVLGPSIWDSSSEPVTEVKTDFTCIVGELDILNNISGNRDHYINVYENPASSSYNIDHIDKAICKINLFPSDPTTFDTWSNNLATGIAALSITVQAEDGSELFFGNNSTLSDTPGEFLYENDEYDADARFRLVNRIAYDIFNANNTYNFLSMNGTNRKRVGRIENIFISSIADTDTINLSYRQVYYYYYDQIDNEHFICECQLYLPRRRSNGVILAQTSTIASIPAGHTSDQAAPAGGDAYWNYYYANGDIVVRDEHHAGDQPRNSTLSGPKDYGIVSYSEENDAAIIASLGINAEIVKMPEDLSISFTVNNVTTRILFTFTSTQRRYANHGCFAAFIGVLAQLSYTNVVSTGMCFEDATSYPSVSHPNGDSIDTVYLENQTKKRAIISAFSEWGFSYIISGTADTGDGADEHRADHNSHLHSGNFLDTNVHVLNR